MRKYIHLLIVALFIVFVASCTTVKTMSIDYLVPARISLPAGMNKVAVINNTADTFAVRISSNDSIQKVIYQANPKTVADGLAHALVDSHYFKDVVLNDSAFQKKGENKKLTQKQVQGITADLGVDFVVAVEGVNMKTDVKQYADPESGYQYIVQAYLKNKISVYIPQKTRPLFTVNHKDTIYWEYFADSPSVSVEEALDEYKMLEEASEFIGTSSAETLVPYWKTGNRFIYDNGSAALRDASLYVKEDNWEKAYELWKAIYKNGKISRRVAAAHNIAVYLELNDNVQEAYEWEEKAVKLTTDKAQKKSFTSYMKELKQRIKNQGKLNIQMNKFKDKF